MNMREKARQLKRDIPALLLALKDKQTPWYAKTLVALTVAYALSPLDLIPDFIPGLGLLDDLLLLPALVALTVRLIPPPVLARCRSQVEAEPGGGLKKRWRYALPVLALWLVLLWLLLRWLWPQLGL